MGILIDSFTDHAQGAGERTRHYLRGRNDDLLVIADGSNESFSIGYQPVIDLTLQQFQDLAATATEINTHNLSQTCADLQAPMDRLFPSSDEFGENRFTATYLVVLMQGHLCFVSWLGSHQIKLYRRGMCLVESSPHIALLPQAGQRPFVITTKMVTTIPNAVQYDAETQEPWRLETGDTLVVADSRLFLLDSADEISRIVSTPQPHPAKRLVEWSQSVHFDFGQSAIVARIEKV